MTSQSLSLFLRVRHTWMGSLFSALPEHLDRASWNDRATGASSFTKSRQVKGQLGRLSVSQLRHTEQVRDWVSWDCHLSPGASVTTACGTEPPPYCPMTRFFQEQEVSTILGHLSHCRQALAAGTEPTPSSLDYPHLDPPQ